MNRTEILHKVQEKKEKENKKRKELEYKWKERQKEETAIRENLLCEMKKGLINWYTFETGTKALFVGESDSPYVDFLSDRGLIVSVVAPDAIDATWAQLHQQEFDYVLSVACLEKLLEPAKALRLLREVVKEDGCLLLGMNNRLGIRYFCGDRDPYTQRNLDGIEGYKRAYLKKEDVFRGRAYSKSELRGFLEEAGWECPKFYSVFSDLDHPSLLLAEGYMTNEDLTNRIFPYYNYPNAVFLEEKNLYKTFVDEGMLHNVPNAFLIECSLKGAPSDVLQVTTSMDRGKEDALITILHANDVVEKRAAFPEGEKRLEQIVENLAAMKARGLKVVDAKIENGALVMPFIKAPVGQVYLKQLLRTDTDAFLAAMDHFRDLIFQSSDITKEDRGDGKGVNFEQAFFDMVPLNSFFIDGEFVFYDQEFCAKNYPANVLLLRMIVSLYYGDMEANKYYPIDKLYERYGLEEKRPIWQRAEWMFLNKLKNTGALWPHYKDIQTNGDMINSNRQRLNYAAEDYDRLFVDIFKNADTRKLILFGSGLFAKKFLTLYGDSYPVHAIIDNQEAKWGEELEGVPICSPEYLKELEKGQYKVLICIKNYLSVMKQLDEMGVGEYSIYDPSKSYQRKLAPIAPVATQGETTPKKYNIGYVAGVFDMFHVGHINLLRRAKEMCNYLIVGVLQDEKVLKDKKKVPVISCEDRVEVLKACRYVDQVEVLPLDYAGIRDAYRLFHFDCQFSGDDHGDEDIWMKEKNI